MEYFPYAHLSDGELVRILYVRDDLTDLERELRERLERRLEWDEDGCYPRNQDQE